MHPSAFLSLRAQLGNRYGLPANEDGETETPIQGHGISASNEFVDGGVLVREMAEHLRPLDQPRCGSGSQLAGMFLVRTLSACAPGPRM